MIERDSSALEEAVAPLLEASTTDSWKHVLNVLYLNGSVLCMSEDLQIPVVVSIDEDPDEVGETMELLEAKFTTAISPLVSSGAKKFVPKILDNLRKGISESKISIDNETAVQSFIIGQVTQILESPDNPLNRLLVQGAFRFGEVVAAGVFDLLAKLWRGHIQSTLEEIDYEDMVEGLRKLGLIESRLQVSICPSCANYELVVSRFLGEPDECSKCGEAWTTARLYTFVPAYEKVKLSNSDLPLFISAYLRHKVSQLAPLGTLDVRPNAVLSWKGLHYEVDVYLPQFDTGIECKIFENSFAPMTAARLGSIQGPLTKQIKNYTSVGIRKIGVVTNLPTDANEKLKSAATKTLQSGSAVVEMIPGNVEELVKWLDELATAIAAQFNKEFEKSVQSAVKPEPKRKSKSVAPLQIKTRGETPTIAIQHPFPKQTEPLTVP
jgi:hypothetical protein